MRRVDRVRFKAVQQPSGIKGVLMLQAEDEIDNLAKFLKTQHAYAKDRKDREPDYELAFDVEIRRWYKRRSIKANNLQWELCSRIAAADGVEREFIHNAVKEVFYPRKEYRGVFAPKDGGELTTVEYAKVIEALVKWCTERPDPIDIYDIWVLFTDWRFGQETDPLEGTYAGPDDYKEKHPLCEACGKFLLATNNYGVQAHDGQLCHIVSRGASSLGQETKDDWDWLVLCSSCHVVGGEGEPSQHQAGWEALLAKAPHLRPKVERARERAGKHPLAAPPAPAVPPKEPAVPPVDAQKQKVLDKLRNLAGTEDVKAKAYKDSNDTLQQLEKVGLVEPDAQLDIF
jgi:cytochrome c553